MDTADLFVRPETEAPITVSAGEAVAQPLGEPVLSTVVSFVIPGEPVPFARAGAKGAMRFTPKRQRDFMSLAKLAACQAMNGRAPIEGPVELTVEAVFLVPSTWSKKKAGAAVWKLSRPDLSNIEKLVEDSLNEIVFLDDTQVVRRGPRSCKRYGDRAETRVTVRMLDSADGEALR